MEGLRKTKGRKGQKGIQSRYDTTFRRRVAMDYVNGDRTMQEVAQSYGVPRHSVKDWIDSFKGELAAKEPIEAVMTEEEQKELAALKKQVEALKKELAYEQMKSFAFEAMIDLAKEELGVDIRKNSGAKQPGE